MVVNPNVHKEGNTVGGAEYDFLMVAFYDIRNKTALPYHEKSCSSYQLTFCLSIEHVPKAALL